MKRAIFRPGGPIPSNGLIPMGPKLDLARPHGRDRFDEEAAVAS